MLGSLVICYDSVTDEGELDWQYELNNSNKFSFNICDGIFINLEWHLKFAKDQILKRSYSVTLSASASRFNCNIQVSYAFLIIWM